MKFFRIRPHSHHPWLWGVFAFLLFLILFLFSALSSLRVFIPYYPEISGFPFGSRNYLIVFQNNNELRPTGGFISAYGILHFGDGILPHLDVADVYGDIDRHSFIEPPYPMGKLLAGPWYQGYTFRDANFSPDYPKTAQELLRMFRLTKPGVEIDGVVAVNYSFLEDLLGVLVSLEIDGKFFTKDTLFENLEYEVNNIDQHDIAALQTRKNILQPLAGILMKKIVLSAFKLRRVSDVVVHSLAKKDIQLFFKSASLQKMALSQGWGGKWPETFEGDFLAVNEANFGGMKSDRYLQRRVTYHFTVDENVEDRVSTLIGDVTIDLYHYGIDNVPLSGNYSGFFRTYVPRGAELIEVAPAYKKDLWQDDDGLFHIFGNIVRLKPGERTQLHYRYLLPLPVLQQQHYQLFIPKQAGTGEDYYTVIAELPQGSGIRSYSFTARENFGVYQNELNGDILLGLDILPDTIPPRVIHQATSRMGLIDITFNENIDIASAKDISHYQVRDLNIKEPGKTDQLKIDMIDSVGKNIKIHLKGMTRQPDERYEVVLSDIRDIHGNLLFPNPKKITVVQRF